MTNDLSDLIKDEKSIFYDKLKNKSEDYITAKSLLKLAFKSSNFGTWVQKPEELRTFEINMIKTALDH